MFEKDDYRKRMDQVVKRIKGNPQLAAQFREEPIKTIEEVLGVSLPDEQVRAMAADIREKIGDRGASEIFTDEERPREGSFIDGLRDNAEDFGRNDERPGLSREAEEAEEVFREKDRHREGSFIDGLRDKAEGVKEKIEDILDDDKKS